MTGNRLTAVATAPAGKAFSTEESMREWCWSKNQECRAVSYPHWVYVHRDPDSRILMCKTRSGSDALDIINLLNGRQPDFKGWDQERLDKEARILAHMARMGMTEEEWQLRSRRLARAPMNAAS